MAKSKKLINKKSSLLKWTCIIIGFVIFIGAVSYFIVKDNPWISLEYYSSKISGPGEVMSKERQDLGIYQNPKRGDVNVKSITYIYTGTGNHETDIRTVSSDLLKNGWSAYDSWRLDSEGSSFVTTYTRPDGTKNPVQVRLFLLEDDAKIEVPERALNKTNTLINIDFGSLNERFKGRYGYKIGIFYFTGR